MREKSEQTTPLSDSKTKKALVALFIFDEFQCIAVIIEWSRLTNGAHFLLYTANSHIFTLSLHSAEMLVKFFAFGVHFSLNRLQLEMCRNLRELSKEIYVLHLHFHCHYNALENRFLPFFSLRRASWANERNECVATWTNDGWISLRILLLTIWFPAVKMPHFALLLVTSMYQRIIFVVFSSMDVVCLAAARVCALFFMFFQ